jgi:hypothetical protein
MDEAAGLHERIGRWSEALIGGRETMILPKTGIWMFLFGIPFVIAIVASLRKLNSVLAESKGAARRFAAGFVVLLTGAVGLEILSNFVDPGTFVAMLQVATEELVEMIGGSILLWAGYTLIRTHSSTADIFEALVPLVTAPLPPVGSSSSQSPVGDSESRPQRSIRRV